MTTPRDLIARAIHGTKHISTVDGMKPITLDEVTDERIRATHYRIADRVLDALADSGLLLPDGGKQREVYEVQTTGLRWPGLTEADAWRQVADVKAWADKPAVQLYRQTVTEWPDGRVHCGPLVQVYADQPAPDPDTTPTKETR